MARKATLALVNPFKVRETPSVAKGKEPPVIPPADISIHVDEFCENSRQATHFAGEVASHKLPILDFCRFKFAERAMTGKCEKSFKLAGDIDQVTFIHEDRGSNLTDDDVADLIDEVGEEAAEKMLKIDIGSFRFNIAALEANFDAVVKALQVLPAEVLETLITPGSVTMRSGAYQDAKEIAETPVQLARIAEILKIRSYIK
jgi:hypothetical protein